PNPVGGESGAIAFHEATIRTCEAPAARAFTNPAARSAPVKANGSSTDVRSGSVPWVEYVRTELADPGDAATATKAAIATTTRMLRLVTPTDGQATVERRPPNGSLRSSYTFGPRPAASCPRGRSAGSSAP